MVPGLLVLCSFVYLLYFYSKVFKDRHFACEDCDGTVSGGFDATSSQVRAPFIEHNVLNSKHTK